MATINYFHKGKGHHLYIRFVNGRKFDISIGTGISIEQKYWDKKGQKIRNVLEFKNRDSINSKLAKLKIYINDQFSDDFINGEIIDKNWLQKTIEKFFNRPVGESENKPIKHLIYYTEYADYWLKTKASKHKVSANKYMDETTVRHYKRLNELVKEFEGRDKLKFKELTSEKIDEFSQFLSTEKGFAYKTAKRMVGRFRFFCTQAEIDNIEVNKNYKGTVFVQQEETTIKEPYLNEEEITKLFNHNFDDNYTLDYVRDNFIIGLWTGLRVSDFLNRLHINDIQDDFIEIKTKKTKTMVAIPLHPHVKSILAKRAGNLPPKILDQKFNKHIKEICRILGMNTVMPGAVSKVTENGEKRKVVGMYKKYELVTSHICRRSFATNLYGKVANSVIMAVAGWSSEAQMLDYIKLTHFEKAKELKEYWNQKY